MFHPDHSLEPGSSSLLAELGIDPSTVREVIDNDRAMRCPDRDAVYSACDFASLTPEPQLDYSLHEPSPAEPWDPVSPFPSAEWRWRRA